jgi:Sec7-like guanine-nucleotide exchange factor
MIMLNTDLHNPFNKYKITKSEFIRNSLTVGIGSELSDGYLGQLYDAIHDDELKTTIFVKHTDNISKFLLVFSFFFRWLCYIYFL